MTQIVNQVTFSVEIDSGNSAFTEDGEDGARAEVARLLRELADKVEGGYVEGQVVEVNGNRCGWWTLAIDLEEAEDEDEDDEE